MKALVPDRTVCKSLDGWCEGECHRYQLRVQYDDTDAGGVVYHAQYLAFAERGRSAWLRWLDINQEELFKDSQSGFVVRHIKVDFERTAKLGEVLDVTSEIVKVGGASLKLQQTIINFKFRHIVARLIVEIGFANMSVGDRVRACRMPKDIQYKLVKKQRSIK